MRRRNPALYGASLVLLALAAESAHAQTGRPAGSFQLADNATATGAATVGELVVTAEKREENIQNVPMSIQAASGDTLTKLGITSTEDLTKIVPGFEVTPNYYGTVVYTIRGVGFQDTSLAGSPTVTVYQDQMPLPFSILTAGATMDLQRVEVLKGPQGTLFGENATAGAINYVANKPTETFETGGDLTLGNFQTAYAQGFVSGPITQGLTGRLAIQYNNSGAWQKGYAQQTGQETGGQDFLNGRLAFEWKPNSAFTALLTLNGWEDKGYNQVGQLYGLAGGRNHAMPSFLLNYPNAPHNDQAAGWVGCVNDSPFDPIAGQQLGVQYLTPINPDGTPASNKGPIAGSNQAPPGYAGPNAESESNGAADAAVLQGAQPTHCVPMRRNNDFFSVNLRMDYALGNGMTATSLTQYLQFHRFAGVDGAGVPEQDYQSLQIGKIESIYQEGRLAGDWWGKGHWVVGGNYQYDNTYDHFLQTYNGSTASPTQIPNSVLCFVLGGCTAAELAGAVAPPTAAVNPYPANFDDTLGPTAPTDYQVRNTWAIFASGDYPILPTLDLQAGIRYTDEDNKGRTCGLDGGDGSWSLVAQQISNLLEVLNPAGYLQQTYGKATPAAPINGFISPMDAYLNHAGQGINAGPGGCGTTGPAPLFQSVLGFPSADLHESNVAWQAGLNWHPQQDLLLYFNVSQGYKGGSFPTVAMSSSAQAVPVRQEGLLSYEVGAKGSWLDHQLTVNGAFFYYDYKDKQILGAETDPIFGPLAELVNVPNSHVIGFELSGTWAPEQLKGFVLTPAVSYQNSHIDNCTGARVPAGAIGCNPNGHFITPDAFSQNVDVTGQSFPSAPEWQASVDGEYDWKIHDDINAFVGFNVQYSGETHTGFQNPNPGPQPAVYATGPGTNNCGGPVVLCYDPGTVPAYTLLDLRAGVYKDAWRFQVWGRNVTNAWYWTAADRINDTILRYTGMPTTYGITISYRFH
jgi:outer membrane receptor protein involved in Fe transport